MAEFKEVLKQRERLCKTTQCIECPLCSDNNKKDVSCSIFVVKYPDEAEKAIMDWAKENPIMTNADKFGEAFGVYPTEESCPFFAHCNNNECNTRCKFGDFWKQGYIEPKGDK